MEPAAPGVVRFYDLARAPESFLDAVVAGLSREQKQVPQKFLSDATGLEYLAQIRELPEYYAARAEMRITVDHIGEFSALFGGDTILIEIGGNSLGTRILLAAFRPPLEQYRTIMSLREQHHHGARAPRGSRACRWNLMLPPSTSRATALLERTHCAQRASAHAHRGAQVHDGLGIHGDVLFRRASFGECPQSLFDRALCGYTGNQIKSRQHAAYIAIENGGAFAGTERANRGSR